MHISITAALLLLSSAAEGATVRGSASVLASPDLDPTCFQAAWNADNAEEACANAIAADGNPCVWCSYLEDAVGVCTSSGQSEIFAQYMQCGDEDDEEEEEEEAPPVPSGFDANCLIVNVQGADAETCTGATADNGDACSWCSIQGRGMCVGPDAADLIMEKTGGAFGVTCGDEDSEPSLAVEAPAGIDMSCLMVNAGDADAETCASTAGDSGDACSWCSFQDYGGCVGSDMADMIMENLGDFGVACGDKASEPSLAVEAPTGFDMSCLMVNAGDADAETCAATTGDDGEACSWCSLQGYGACMGSDTAAMIMEKGGAFGVTCGDEEALEASTGFDMSCLMVNIGDADAETCASTAGDEGDACSWCSFQDYGACLGSDLAAMITDKAGDLGVTCGAEESEPSVAVE